MFIVGLALWIGWTMRYATRNRVAPSNVDVEADASLPPKHAIILAIAVAPMAAYVYGALRLDWGLNELSGAFLVGGFVAGVAGGLGIAGTLAVYLEGMQGLLPAALMIGVARSISLVLEDGRVVDTILNDLAVPLSHAPAALAAFLMIGFHAIIHIPVPSVSGQAVLTMPLVVPLADLLGLSRQVPVLAYQTGAGLADLMTPTNGALMAVLVAAGVSFQRWIRFAFGAVILATLLGIVGIAAVIWLGVG
jgi:uncharacterized ion transporter superfamily protein YfcC